MTKGQAFCHDSKDEVCEGRSDFPAGIKVPKLGEFVRHDQRTGLLSWAFCHDSKDEVCEGRSDFPAGIKVPKLGNLSVASGAGLAKDGGADG